MKKAILPTLFAYGPFRTKTKIGCRCSYRPDALRNVRTLQFNIWGKWFQEIANGRVFI